MHFKVRKTGLVVKLFIFNVSSGYIDFSSVSVLNLTSMTAIVGFDLFASLTDRWCVLPD